MARPEKISKLVNLLATTSWDQRQMARRKLVERLLLSGFVASFAFIVLISLLSHQWHTGDWWDSISDIYGGIGLLIVLTMSVVFLRQEWREIQRLLTAALALRAAAEERDEQLAPLAAKQPQPLALHELANRPERFPLFGDWKDSAGFAAGFGVLLLLLGAGLGVALVFLVGLIIQPGPAVLIAALTVVAILICLSALGGVVMGLVFLMLSWGRPRHTFVVADKYGVRWWRSGWHHLRLAFIPWNAVTSFFVIAYTGDKEARSGTFYVLDAHQRLLFWRVPATVPKERLARLERFHAVVAARTDLPLRDLSEAAAQVTRIAEEPLVVGEIPQT